jgi:hypothetical protein
LSRTITLLHLSGRRLVRIALAGRGETVCVSITAAVDDEAGDVHQIRTAVRWPIERIDEMICALQAARDTHFREAGAIVARDARHRRWVKERKAPMTYAQHRAADF